MVVYRVIYTDVVTEYGPDDTRYTREHDDLLDIYTSKVEAIRQTQRMVDKGKTYFAKAQRGEINDKGSKWGEIVYRRYDHAKHERLEKYYGYIY